MKTLYKYVSSTRALACLPEIGDGALRATQPSALNDPFECATMRNVSASPNDEDDNRLSISLTNINSHTPVTARHVAEARERFGSLYMRELMSQQVSKRFGVISFASSPYHPLMWSHYTVDGSGYAIGYAENKLKTLCKDKRYLRRILYVIGAARIGDYSHLSDDHYILQFLAHKSSYWKYEKEWRLIMELTNTIGTGQCDHHGQPINLVRIPNEAVVEVFYTERTPAKAVDEIRNRLHDQNNRYGTNSLTKLALANERLEYAEEHPNA